MALSGKVALITGMIKSVSNGDSTRVRITAQNDKGGSAGIGAGIAVCFVKEGADVCISGRSQDKLDKVAKQCEELRKGKVLTCAGDITKKGEKEKLVEATIQCFGKIDILVNNAGYDALSLLSETTEEFYDSIMDINLRAPVFLTKLCVPHLVQSKGSVINISSIYSYVSGEIQGIYSMSKSALDVFTKTLARELGPKGVRVNSVNPGLIPETDIFSRHLPEGAPNPAVKLAKEFVKFVPVGRNGTVEDVGQTVVFLASDNASFISGQTLCVDGGALTKSAFVINMD